MAQIEKNKNFKIDFDVVEKLVELVKASNVGKIKVVCNGFEVEVESKKESVVCSSALNGYGVKLNSQVLNQGVSGVDLTENQTSTQGNVVKCPIVGTFYSSPAPGKPEFVKVGDSVKVGDVLFIVESMKLMNEVKSEFSGVVKEICVKSGEPVEFDQKIMVIG